jgi:hypothetical protein
MTNAVHLIVFTELCELFEPATVQWRILLSSMLTDKCGTALTTFKVIETIGNTWNDTLLCGMWHGRGGVSEALSGQCIESGCCCEYAGKAMLGVSSMRGRQIDCLKTSW